MIASAKQPQHKGAVPAWHADFLAMLPSITHHAQVALRDRRGEAKEDLIQEVTAYCFAAYHRLVERDKSELAFPSVLVGFALRKIYSGRRVGTRLNALDVTSHCARHARCINVARLEHFDEQAGEWRELLVEDRKAGPAETAAVRIDFGAWLGSLSNRNRRIAEMLASGETTGAVAKTFGLTAARVSQLRVLLKASWERLQDGARAS